MITRWRSVVLVAALGLAVLGGCGDDDDGAVPATPGESEPEPAETTPSSAQTSLPTTSAPTPGTGVDCLVGEWQLDLADFQAQAMAYIGGLGIPIESLSIEGEQVLIIEASGIISYRDNTLVNAVVHGVPVSAISEAVGNGEWSTDSGVFTVENWLWGVAPTAEGAAAPFPGFDPSQGVFNSRCSTGDVMRLQGPGAPLAANFVRV